MPKSLKISLLAFSVTLILCIFAGVNAPGVAATADSAPQNAYRQINVYGEVLQHIQSDYVEVPNIPKVTNGALRGLLESLDADSSYLTPADYKAYQADQGGKAQVGINVSKRYGYAIVVSVVPGSPADKAGLGDGDIIQAIGNQDTGNLSLAMIRLLLQGEAGSRLQLAVVGRRSTSSTPQKVTLTRVIVTEPPISTSFYDGKSILYLNPEIIDRQHVQEHAVHVFVLVAVVVSVVMLVVVVEEKQANQVNYEAKRRHSEQALCFDPLRLVDPLDALTKHVESYENQENSVEKPA